MNKLSFSEFQLAEMEGNTANVRELLKAIKSVVPEFKLKFKDEHPFWKRVPFNRNATITIRDTVFYPSRIRANQNQESYFDTLAHEFVHLVQRREMGPLFYTLLYLSPQAIGLLLLVLSTIPWAMGAANIVAGVTALSMALIAPWPAPGRVRIEREGYQMNLAIEHWRRGSISKGLSKWVGEALTGKTYYWMLWSKKKAKRIVEDSILEVVTSSKSFIDKMGIASDKIRPLGIVWGIMNGMTADEALKNDVVNFAKRHIEK